MLLYSLPDIVQTTPAELEASFRHRGWVKLLKVDLEHASSELSKEVHLTSSSTIPLLL